MESNLLLIAWLASVLYGSIPLFWFAIHPFAGYWRRMRRSPYRWLLPLWIAIIAALAWLSWPWHEVRIYSTPWMWLPALALFVFGLNTYRKIRSEFGARKLSGEAELRLTEHEQRLVTTGMHARMRHPIYFAHLCNLAGCAVASGLLVPFVLLSISAFVTFPLMIWLEERELAKRFGQEFHNYKQAVPLFPKFFLSSPNAKTGPEKNAPGLIAGPESQNPGFLRTPGKQP
jgi:protein-S-isoprenylcysteine O-methyltransferase Ste14